MKLKYGLVTSVLLGATATATAQISAIGEFTGALNEGFESFNNYNENSGQGYDPLVIMGGAATMSDSNPNTLQTWIYEVGTANWDLIDKGFAPAHTGTQGAGLWNNGQNGVVDLTFVSGMLRFGGWFNTADNRSFGGTNRILEVRFFDSADVQIGSAQFVQPEGNPLEWHGWSSTVVFKRVEFSYEIGPAMDDLQADPIPEPASLAAVGLGFVALLRRRRNFPPPTLS